MERPASEVSRIMGFAKLDPSDTNPCVQSLYLNSELNNEKYKLLEVDHDILRAVEEGKSLVIRGDREDGAVLCTDDRNYDIKGAETSNTLLLLPQCRVGPELHENQGFHNHIVTVSSIHHTYYELRGSKPKFRKLRLLLEENPFSGPECEDDEAHQGAKYTLADLLEEVQASEDEIRQHLEDIGACLIQNYWRVLDFDYKLKILELLLQIAEEENSPDTLSISKCCELLSGIYPSDIIEHTIKYLSERKNNQNEYKISDDKVCQLFAEMILRPVEEFNLTEFLRVWQQSVPEGITTSEYQLEGLALIDRDSQPGTIRLLSVNDLPEDINERFDALFKVKDKWALNDITPYVKDLCSEKQTVSALLTKYARASTSQQGIKVFSSKRPKS